MSSIFFTTHLIVVTYWAEKTLRLSVFSEEIVEENHHCWMNENKWSNDLGSDFKENKLLYKSTAQISKQNDCSVISQWGQFKESKIKI